MSVQRTEFEPDDYLPVAKHARRGPTGARMGTAPESGASKGRGTLALTVEPGTRARRGFPTIGEDSLAEPTEFVAPATLPAPAAAPDAGPDIDRVGAVWRARYAIVACTVLVGLVVYLLASASAPVYSSSATVSVTAASTPGGSAQDVALASNSLAAQDTLLVTSDSVVAAAARHLGIAPSTLSSHLSSGTLSAQNLVQITVQGPTKLDALRWVQATTIAFQAYLQKRAQTTSTALSDSIAAQTQSLTQQIEMLQYVIDNSQNAPAGSTALTDLQSYQNQLNQLVGTRATLTANTALAIASEQPVITITASGSSPNKISPRPTLYATVAALLTLLVAAQLAIFAARRKANKAEPL